MMFVGGLSSAQQHRPLLTDLVNECQKWAEKEQRMSLTWWIPTEYWRFALAGNKEVPPEAIDQLEKVFADYVIICVADLRVHSNGTLEFNDKSAIRKTLTFSDASGKTFAPLEDAQINDEALMVAERIKPMFEQALGQMGKGLYFFFFDVKSGAIDAAGEGNFKVMHSGSEFAWKLPLNSLLPPKYCPVDQEVMLASWNYCPTHGDKLGE